MDAGFLCFEERLILAEQGETALEKRRGLADGASVAGIRAT